MMSANSFQNTPTLTSEEKNWGMFCHLSSLLGYVLAPSCHLFAPLIVWLLKRNESPFIDAQGKESLNFQLSITIYGFAALASCITVVLIPLAILVGIALWLMGLICTIIGSVKASNGEFYDYPFTIRFLK